jgi:hypothetical protein
MSIESENQFSGNSMDNHEKENLWLRVKDFILGVKDVFKGLTSEERSILEQRGEKLKELAEEFNGCVSALFCEYTTYDDLIKETARAKEIYREVTEKMGMTGSDMVLMGFDIESFDVAMREKKLDKNVPEQQAEKVKRLIREFNILVLDLSIPSEREISQEAIKMSHRLREIYREVTEEMGMTRDDMKRMGFHVDGDFDFAMRRTEGL